MMTIIFKAAHIAFAVHKIWDFELGQTNEGTLFKSQLIEKFKTVKDIEDDVTVDISANVLVSCFNAVRQSPYGYTNSIADEMKTSLVAQVQAQSNFDEENPNEAYEALKKIAMLGSEDDNITLITISSGFDKIRA